MTPSLIAGGAVLVSLFLIAIRTPIAFALLLGSVGGLTFFYGYSPSDGLDLGRASAPLFAILGDVPFRFVHSYELSTIPLYILLGAVAHSAGITSDVFTSMRTLVGRIPGGLAIAAIFGCGGFSALSGSSLACAAAMGRIAVPEMMDRGYGARLATGAVAVGGTLGALIPPSIPFLVFAILAEQSVGRLLLAGVVPGLITLLGYLITTFVWVRLRPEIAPAYAEKRSLRDVVDALLLLWPATLLLAIIIGGIFSGLFTTIQAAAVSVICATAIGVMRRRLTVGIMATTLRDSVLQSAQLFVMAFGAKIMITLIAATNLSGDLIGWTEEVGLGRWETMMAIVALLLVMGMFLEPMGILLLVVPITLPVVEKLGFEVIWYAVIFVKMLEVGLITPPVGLNAFMVKAAVPARYGITLQHIFTGILPFLVLEAVVVGLLLAFPILSLYLPQAM